ncbi:AI-2E family transporter [Candidatus Microgenomates bacterium]|nr:AI-2E family transporter [Candidatus Microgenomates bacterium]
MTIATRTSFLIFIALLIAWVLYLVRAVLPPFILAAVFAYILNPPLRVFAQKSKLPRAIFIVILYVLFFAGLGWGGTFLSKQLIREAQDLASELVFFVDAARSQIDILPVFLRDFVHGLLLSVQEGFNIEPQAVWPFFSGAASRVFTFITFLFASFYFLKDGEHFIEKILFLLHKEHKIEAEKLLIKINLVLGNYLRGQLSLVLLMAVVGFILLTALGVRFSLILGLVIGLAEIVPMIGPIIAGTITVFVAVFDGASQFGLPPIYDGLIVLSAYVILNQIENYLIVPQVMGKAIDLHPLLIFFAVLAGGHLFGILGFILAVPILAVLRVLLEYLLKKFTS